MNYVNVYNYNWQTAPIGHIKTSELTAKLILQLARLGYSLELPKQAG